MRWGRGVLWAALVVPLVVEAFAVERVWLRWGELVVGASLLAAAVLLFERVPVATLCGVVAVAAVPALVVAPTAVSPGRVWPFVACAVFGYLAGRRVGAVRPLWTALAGVGLAALPVGMVVDGATRGGFGLLFGLYDWFVLVLILLLTIVLPWLVGRYRRQRVELVSAEWERAALRERSRIAREMHDSLGHEWGLIALRAAAFEVSPDLDERAREQAGELRAGVAAATERLQQIIGLLGETERVDLAELVERARAAGMIVELGPVPDGLPAAVARAAHRVVQEGLTNAGRHAAGAPVSVVFRADREATTVTVSNGPAAGRSVPGNGFGLAGLRERVRLLGGSVDAGPRDGGFVLTATLPHDAPPGEAAGPHRVRARTGLVRAVRLPLLAGAVVAVLALGLDQVVGANNSLDPDTYRSLRIGQSQVDVEERLPPFQILGDPRPRAGADCRQYWASEQRDGRLYYRLCFAEGRLAFKETVPLSAVSDVEDP